MTTVSTQRGFLNKINYTVTAKGIATRNQLSMFLMKPMTLLLPYIVQYIKDRLKIKEFSDLATDWLAAHPPANQKPFSEIFVN